MNEDNKIRLLLVEDDVESGDSMVLMLRKRGVEVTLVPSGEEALALFDSNDFDVVVSDIRLMKMSGVEVLNQIRREHPFFPVILLTGYDSIESAISALHQGAQDYILKPLDSIDQLLKPVQAAVSNYRLRLESMALEQELAASERRFRKIYENAAVGVMLLDESGDIIQFNHQAQKMFNLNECEPSSMNLFRMHASDGEQSTLRMMFSDLKSGTISLEQQETRFKRCRGEDPFWCTVFLSTFDAEQDESHRFLAILMDIDEKKQLESRLEKHREGLFQAEKLVAIGKMAGGIAHDFNNVLYIITGNVRLAMEKLQLGSEEQEKLVNALAACEAAVDMTERIYHPTQSTSAEKKPINVQNLIKHAVDILSFRLADNIETVLYLDEPESLVVGDHLELQQVFMNLMMNAVQAMHQHGGQLKITLQEYETDEAFIELHPGLEPGKYLCLKVTDTGVGIAPENLDRIYEPFFTTRTAEGGCGLGLSLVHSIVKDHGGMVDINSTPDVGTSFFVYLPITSVELSEAQDLPQLPTGTQSILLVDDDPQVLKTTEGTLQQLGYSTTSFTDCSACLADFSQNSLNYDLAIIDFVMPKMTGGQLCRELLTIRNDIPIIILTAFTYSMTASADSSSKVHKYISKNMSPVDFAQTIHNVLQQKDTQHETDRTILIIDDNSEARKILREVLENAAYRVIEAPNGKSGVDQFMTHHVDLIVTDIFMPDKDGLEVVMECKKYQPDIKIFVFSGGSGCAGWDCLPLAKSLGADKAFRSPVDHQLLLDSIYEYLK